MDKKKLENKIYSKLLKDKAILWSFSNVNGYETCPYAQDLTKQLRKLKIKPDNNIYAVTGTLGHDILEKHYMKEDFQDIKTMLPYYNNELIKILASGLKFPSTKIQMDYIANMRLYFQMFKTDPNIVECEKFIGMPLKNLDKKLKDHYFQGWADAILNVNGEISIGDFKSSTKYVGQDLIHKSRQLILYAIAYEHCYKQKVKSVFFDFMKYCKVIKKGANGKETSTIIPRKDLYMYDNYIRVEKAYVFVELTYERKKEVTDWFIELINKKMNDTEFLAGEDTGTKSFYCKTLCGVSKYCKYMGNKIPLPEVE